MYQQGRSFSSINRLNRPKEYRQAFHSRCRSIDDTLLVIARENGLQFARLGLAISQKKIRHAVDRNKLKRMVRESFRHHQQLLSGLDVVVVSHKQLSQINNRRLLSALSGHWQTISRCKKT